MDTLFFSRYKVCYKISGVSEAFKVTVGNVIKNKSQFFVHKLTPIAP